MSVHKPRTNIAEIPVANEELYDKVSKLTKQRKAAVRDMVEFIGTFIADTMEKGDMQGVMLPYFGKFRPKVKQLRRMKQLEMQRANGMDVVFKAIQGKIVAVPVKPDTDETI